jgi:hypothetical protein
MLTISQSIRRDSSFNFLKNGGKFPPTYFEQCRITASNPETNKKGKEKEEKMPGGKHLISPQVFSAPPPPSGIS